MANKRVTELPILSEWADDDEVLVTDVSDVDSVPESSPDGTLKRTTFADLKDETTAAALAAVATGPLPVGKPTGAGQASRITAYNKDTGQYQLDGIEHGNTGWRRITPINGWVDASNRFRLIRYGHTVELQFISRLDGSAATSNLAYTFPAGFRPLDSRLVMLLEGASAGAFQAPTASGYIGNDLVLPTGKQLSAVVSWQTSEAWPSSLPGVQVTAPYTLPV